MNTFEDLEAWKSARELRKAISKLVKTFPKDERFRLVDQIIRSSRSVRLIPALLNSLRLKCTTHMYCRV